MSPDEKAIRERCPKQTNQMAIHEDTGLRVVAKTGLVPLFFVESIPERGWNRGEVHGVLPKTALKLIKDGTTCMELPDDESKPAAAPSKKKEQAQATA